MSKCTPRREADRTPHDRSSKGSYGPRTVERNGHEVGFGTWNTLTEKAAAKGVKLPYSDLGALLGIDPLVVRFALVPIQRHRLREDLPPRDVLVVNERTGRSVPLDGCLPLQRRTPQGPPRSKRQGPLSLRGAPWPGTPRPLLGRSGFQPHRRCAGASLRGSTPCGRAGRW